MAWLDNIRNKPHETKIRIIWVSAAGVVVLLVLVWLLVGQMELNPNKSFIGTIAERIGHPSKTFPKIFGQ